MKPDDWPEDLFRKKVERSREDLQNTRDRVANEMQRMYMAWREEMENPFLSIQPGDVFYIEPKSRRPRVVRNDGVSDYFDKLWLAEIGIKI